MPWDLGDKVPLSVEIKDSGGQLANATSVTIAITLPDGTTHSPGVVLPHDTGKYAYDYDTIQAGVHVVRWVATGTNASAFTDSFVVNPIESGDFISLRDAKEFLRLDLDANTYDELLRYYISAACAMIVERVGPVAPTRFVEQRCSTNSQIILEHYPVIDVVSVEQLPGLVAVPQGDLATGQQGWYLESDTGILRHTHLWDGHLVRITYRVGRSPLPANFRLAALSLVAHLWRTDQMNSGGNRPLVNQDGQTIHGTTYALPYNVRQLLGLDKRPQSRVMI